MQAAQIIPVEYPDTVEDAAFGATFYVDAKRYPHAEGIAWLRMDYELGPSAIGTPAVRLRDGVVIYWPPKTACRVVALVAEVSGEDW